MADTKSKQKAKPTAEAGLAGWGVKRLWGELASRYADGWNSLAAIARVYVALRDKIRGDKEAEGRLKAYSVGAFEQYFDAIAADTLLAGLVLRYHEEPRVLYQLSRLSLEDQERVLSDETVPLWRPNAPVKRVPFTAMTTAEMLQVVSNRKIRTAKEQESSRHTTRQTRRAETELTPGGVNPPPESDLRGRSVVVRFWEREYDLLVAEAAKAGRKQKLHAMIREAVLTHFGIAFGEVDETARVA